MKHNITYNIEIKYSFLLWLLSKHNNWRLIHNQDIEGITARDIVHAIVASRLGDLER